jgi:hypothetical protein
MCELQVSHVQMLVPLDLDRSKQELLKSQASGITLSISMAVCSHHAPWSISHYPSLWRYALIMHHGPYHIIHLYGGMLSSCTMVHIYSL